MIFGCPHCGGPNDCPRPGVFQCCDCGRQFEALPMPTPATSVVPPVQVVTHSQSSRPPSPFGIAFGGCFGILVAVCAFFALGTFLLLLMSIGCLSCADHAIDRGDQLLDEPVRQAPPP